MHVACPAQSVCGYNEKFELLTTAEAVLVLTSAFKVVSPKSGISSSLKVIAAEKILEVERAAVSGRQKGQCVESFALVG